MRARHRVALAGVGALLALLPAAVLALPEPAFGTTPDTGSGGAFGIQGTGPLTIPPNPSVNLPPDGVPPQQKTGPGFPFGPFVSGIFNVTTSSSDFGTSSETIDSSATLSQTTWFGPTFGRGSPSMGMASLTTTCSSSASGSSGQTAIGSLTIGHVTLPVSGPVPVDDVIAPSQLGPLGGLISVTLNVQTVSNTPNDTSIVVDGAVITLLSGFGQRWHHRWNGGMQPGETFDVAQSSCSASGPDIGVPPAVTPEAPAMILLPVFGVVGGGGAALAFRRSRRRRRARLL